MQRRINTPTDQDHQTKEVITNPSPMKRTNVPARLHQTNPEKEPDPAHLTHHHQGTHDHLPETKNVDPDQAAGVEPQYLTMSWTISCKIC